MVKYKIIHFKEQCISCGACARLNPKHWEMEPEGLAQLKGAVKIDDHWELALDTEEERELNKESIETCPVNIIHLVENKEKENSERNNSEKT